MKRIIPSTQPAPEYEDARRIVRICAADGIVVSCLDAYEIWKDYSEIIDAEWITLPVDNGRVLEIILRHSQYVKE